MTAYLPPDENTLGTRRSLRGKPAPTGVAKALRQASELGPSLGTGYLGLGTVVIVIIVGAYEFVLSAIRWDVYPNLLPIIAAWVLFAATVVTVTLTLPRPGERMPTWRLAAMFAALAGVVALDFVAIWPLDNIGEHATVSIAAGFALLIVVTFRSGRVLLVAAAALAAAFIAAVLMTTPLTAHTIPTQIGAISLAVLPVLLGVAVVRNFRGMVQLELDRVLVQSTVSAPRFAVGMLASEELARLDLAAEELLDAVATGRTNLPLEPATASVAASLATELRLHLIEGRRETWLYHAVTESELLGKAVTLTDRGSLAGLLSPAQRDGLLSAVWLLVSDTAKPNASHAVQLSLGPMGAAATRSPGNKIVVPVVISTTDVSRNRVDPATWDSIRRVGNYRDSIENSSLRVDIECLVENPADQQ